MRSHLRLLALLLVAVVSLGPLYSGCTPRCQSVCTKMLDCGIETTRVSRAECELSCQLQQQLYEDWEDEVKVVAFREHRRCIRSSTCEEIADGACYDEELFVFEPQSPVDP